MTLKASGAIALLASLLGAAGAPPAGAQSSYDCVIDPSRVAKLGSPVTGILQAVLVERGDTVTKGQIIARVGARVEEASVRLLTARAGNMAEIEAQLARLDLAERKLARTRALIERRVATAAQLEELEAEVEVARRELALARLRRDLAGLELKRAEEQAARYVIRSPMDGVIVERHMSAGEYVHSEAEIATVARLHPLYAEAFLPVSRYPDVAVGMTAMVRLDEPVGGSVEGLVTIVDNVFDSSSGTFGVRVEVQNPELTLPAGHRCTVSFTARPAAAAKAAD